jgi:hypothetical protein
MAYQERMNARLGWVAALVAAWAMTGCDEKKAEPAKTETKPPATATTTAAASATASAPTTAASAPEKSAAPASLTADQAKKVLESINELCGDTWCEGQFDWKFQALECKEGKCKLSFTATNQDTKKARKDSIDFDVKGAMVDEDGDETDGFSDALSAAISAWEDKHR